jgi:hypothetical protein
MGLGSDRLTHAAARHRHLDGRFADVLARDGEPGARGALMPSRLRGKEMRTMSAPRVLLTTLSVRTSARGRQYLSGFLGKSRVVAFEGEADRFGNATWDIFVAEPEPREGTPGARQGLSERDEISGRTEALPNAGARPSSFHRAPRAESAADRKAAPVG